MKNSIEEDIKNAEHFIKSIKTDKEYKEENGWHGYYNKEIVELARILEHILSDYKRVLKENEELKILEDDIQDKRIVYIDTPEFEENYISKQKIKDKIDKLKELKMDIITSPVHNVDEKLEILKKNKIKLEILQELIIEVPKKEHL